MSGGLSTTTNPWAGSSGNDTLSMLKEHGYNAVETLSGKYSVDLGNGQKVEFEKWEPLWTVLSRIESAKTQEEKKEENIIQKWKKEYLESSKEASELAEADKVKEDYFTYLLRETREQLADIFEPFKKEFNVKKTSDLSNVEASTLGEKRALLEAKTEATKCDGDISAYEKLKLYYNIKRGDDLLTAFMDACSATKLYVINFKYCLIC